MSEPIKMWPPNGGDPVGVLPQNVETMRRRGWKEIPPEAVQYLEPETPVEDDEPIDD